MRKIVLLALCTVLLLSGCSSKENESSSTAEILETQTETESTTVVETTTENLTEPSAMPVTEISENIKLYDLSFPENIEYRPKNKVVGAVYKMSDYGSIMEKDGNIYLETDSGESTPLIELPYESETIYVVINFVIDDSRFAYTIIQEDSSLGCGIYDLADGNDFRIEPNSKCYYIPKYSLGEYLILSRRFISEYYGYSILNLNTYELTDVNSKYIPKDPRKNTAFADDGKTAAVISKGKSEYEYTLTLFSFDDDKMIDEYTFTSDKEYPYLSLEFVPDNKFYVYADDKILNHYLYVIDVSSSMGWQGAYRQKLLEFMESEDYFEKPPNEMVKQSMFSLYDISGDNIPELIISPNDCHAASCDVYTYDTEIISLGQIGSYGSMGYYNDKNIIVSYNLGQGIEYTTFLTLENNELNRHAHFYNDRGYHGDENAAYKLDDIEITKDEYEREIEKYIGNEYISLGRNYTFNEINKAFEEYKET